jgi:amino acid permease
MYFPKENVGGTIKANLGIIMAILFMLGYIVMFILYNLVEDVSNTLNTSIVRTALLAFIPVFVVSLVLSIPVIRLQVEADKPEQLIKKIRKSEKEGNEVISEIGRDGIS